MSARWLIVWLLAVSPGSAAAQRDTTGGFPHERHDRLFPLCESCHLGIQTGDASSTYPPETSCRNCHDGVDEREVNWRRPVRTAGLLRFSHVSHAREVDSTARQCSTCHGASGESRMNVRSAEPTSCLGCHTHRAESHLADDNRCATCHVALPAAIGLSPEEVAALPRPPSHDRADFASAHEPATEQLRESCAVCHARESCARCHVNASTQPVVAALARDSRVAGLLVGRPASYPVPRDHRADDFAWYHGEAAADEPSRCATCHARPSCTVCHIGAGAAAVIRQIPVAEAGGARGVRLVRPRAGIPPPGQRGTPSAVPSGFVTEWPGYITYSIGSGGIVYADTMAVRDTARVVTVHDPGFASAHATAAAAATLTCSGCHDRSLCSDCHAGEGRRRFHPANYTIRHASSAYAREADCASCHNTEVFCRSCHQQSGLASQGRLDVAFHTAQPQWLLQHGRAARQGLANCTACHNQRDCLTCHSTVGWSINPHGRGFDARRMARQSPTTCLVCHVQVPRS